MSKIAELKAKVAEKQAAYHALHTKHAAALKEISDAGAAHVALMAQLSDAITEGAKPCPKCGAKPHGQHHPLGHNRFEFEIGCTVCPPIKHPDGTMRRVAVRGGLLPKHAAELWNEAGPDDMVVKKT